MNRPTAVVDMRWRSAGVVWWRWSALIAFGVTGIELLCLVFLRLLQTAPNLPGSPLRSWGSPSSRRCLSIRFYFRMALSRTARIGTTDTLVARFVRSNVVCTITHGARSWYEAAVAAPLVLGFLVPRFVVPRLALTSAPAARPDRRRAAAQRGR